LEASWDVHELSRYLTLELRGISSYQHPCDKKYAGELVLRAVGVETGGNFWRASRDVSTDGTEMHHYFNSQIRGSLLSVCNRRELKRQLGS
jgi:hypothetical protein